MPPATNRALAWSTSRIAGISPQYLSEIERGHKDPSSEMIAAVSGALGVDLPDLLGGITENLLRRQGQHQPAERSRGGPLLMAA